MHIFQQFSVKVALRLVILFGLLLALSSIFGNSALFFNQLIIGTLVAISFFELLRYIQRTNREMTRLLNALLYRDFVVNFQSLERLGGSFAELGNSLENIIEDFKQVRSEKEGQQHFIAKVLENVPVGILVVKGNNSIEHMNNYLSALLEIEKVNQLAHLTVKHSTLTAIINSEEETHLIEITTLNALKKLHIKKTDIVILKEQYKIITVQDIGSELSQQEMQAWSELISILTHEIMNSVTPITSLTETMNGILMDENEKVKTPEELNPQNVDDIHQSLLMVRERCEGIGQFVDSYRKVAKVPQPNVKSFSVHVLLQGLERLFHSQLKMHRVYFNYSVSPQELSLLADFILVEQALINLITNSLHALEHESVKQLSVSCYEKNQQIIIAITDNGVGIPREKRNKIFVPFFTTRHSGSGIGLSLTRQIMFAHGGDIQVESEEGVFTTFYLIFKK